MVTGGCGFVGSNLVRGLLDRGVKRCIVIDNLFTGDSGFLPDDPRVHFVKGSVTDQKLLDEWMPKVEYVIHCAAVNIIAAQKDPLEDLEVNTKGTLRMLRTAVRLGHIKKFVYTSTASVYGNPPYLPIVEETATNPISNYAVSKLAAENYAIVNYLIDDLPTAVIRYSNVYGPYQSASNRFCGVISKFISSIHHEGCVNIHGTGEQTRDYTYVDDAVAATILAAENPKSEGMIFNVATGHEVSVLEIARRLFRLMDKPEVIRFIDKRDIDNIPRRYLNIARVRTRLKWEPMCGLDTGLERTVEWFKAHPEQLVPK